MTWDHGFAGAGIAACLLARRVVRDGLGSVLLVDRPGRDPRTLAFWTDGPTPLDDAIVHRWSALRVVGAGVDRTVALGDSTYGIVRADTLRARARAEVVAAGGRVVDGEVTAVVDGPEGAAIEVDGARYPARWVYDARRELPPPSAGRLLQSFVGWWVETDDDRFDPTVATLMDFRAAQEPGGVRFFHVLPTSARRALVTGVNFAPDPRPVAVDQYLEALGVPRWRVTGEERGVTPMDARRIERRAGPHTLRIGVAGGLLKPSTGYALTRMLADADRVADHLRTAGDPFAPSTPRAWSWRALDAVLLRLVARRGPDAAEVFVALFTRNPIDRVLRFLDERATVGELVRLVLGLPHWGWFARAAFAALWTGRAQ
ncbi:MAG: lycopene cyclase family protein [Myxococcota bacterium]